MEYTLIVFFCSFLYGVSAVLCKYGLQHNIEIKELTFIQNILFVIRNKVWLIGIFISFVANVTIVEIQSIIDISVVYPILNLSFIFTLILGYIFLNEDLNTKQWFGVATVVIGTLLIIFLDDPETGDTTNVTKLLLFSSASIFVVALLIHNVKKYNIENYEIWYAVCTGVSLSNVEAYVKADTNLVISELGYFTIMSSESLIHFVSIWPFLLLLIFTIIGWLCMQITYSHGNVSVTVPLFAVVQSSMTLMNGYLVFGESFDIQKITGVITILIGVSVLIFSTMYEKEVKTI